MADISSISTIPSIDILVNQFIQKERQPVTKLESRKSNLSKQKAVFLDLKSKFKAVQDRIDTFTTIGEEEKLSAKQVTLSDSTIFTAEATSEASLGVNTLFVSRVAKNDIVVSDRFTISGTSLVDDFAGETINISVTVGSGDTKEISISFSSSLTTNEDILAEVADAITDASIGISAKVVKDTSSTVKLSLVSDEVGTDNEIKLADEDSSGGLLKTIGFIQKNNERREATSTSGGYIYEETENLDAQFTLNGIEITRSSNEIDDVLTGVTITLNKAQSSGDEAETLRISQDTSTIKEQLENFMTDYNSAISYIKEKTGVDPTTKSRGALSGNFIYQNLKIRIRSIASSKVSGIESGKPQTLRDIGVKINSDGTLVLDDEDKLEEALEAGPTTVSDLLTSTNGIASRIDSELQSFTRTGGTIDDSSRGVTRIETSINSQISRYETRLKFKEGALRQQFAELQRTLTLLNTQQTMLQNSGFMTYGSYGSSYGNSRYGNYLGYSYL